MVYWSTEVVGERAPTLRDNTGVILPRRSPDCMNCVLASNSVTANVRVA